MFERAPSFMALVEGPDLRFAIANEAFQQLVGRRDLVGSRRDAMASVANYFNKHGWMAGQPVVARAQAQPGADGFKPETFEAKYTLDEIAAHGYRAVGPVPALPATLVTLEGAEGTEHWIAFKNFHVITRYNRSPLYAMAVHQLSQAIAGREIPPA